jgi:hypothetical protein
MVSLMGIVDTETKGQNRAVDFDGQGLKPKRNE